MPLTLNPGVEWPQKSQDSQKGVFGEADGHTISKRARFGWIYQVGARRTGLEPVSPSLFLSQQTGSVPPRPNATEFCGRGIWCTADTCSLFSPCDSCAFCDLCGHSTAFIQGHSRVPLQPARNSAGVVERDMHQGLVAGVKGVRRNLDGHAGTVFEAELP